MGLAESHDGGTTWQRVSDDPIMDRGAPPAPDAGGACVPMVIRVGERWVMWYSAGVVDPDGRTKIHLCLAFSDDGQHWDKFDKNPVLTDDYKPGQAVTTTSRCYVRHDEGVYRMWYSHSGTHPGNSYRIRYAESLDGIAWERSPITFALVVSPHGWDDKRVEYPEIQVVNGVFRLWFCGNEFGSVGYAEGIADATVRLFVRSGAAADRLGSWQEVHRHEPLMLERFAQVRAELASTLHPVSPAVNRIAIVEE
jgi:hypothetical protein